jgi:NADH-quinone oxidoreductase subunit J
MEKFFFLIFAVVAVVSALGVVALRNPVHSALSLIVSFFQIACLYVLLRAPFLAAAQVFIYVGAVMVLFLFVAMILDVKKVEMEPFPFAKRWFVYLIVPFTALEFLIVISGGAGVSVPAATGEVAVAAFGRELFTRYLFPFEVVSILLLAAMVGAIVLSKKRWR